MSKVMVVDDDMDIRDLVVFKLRKEGHEVTGFGDPREALAAATTTDFDLAVLDWSMPQMDGGELCARLRELPHLRDTPVLIVTAHADPEVRDQAFGAGATEYLAKPFSFKQLAAVVAELLARTP